MIRPLAAYKVRPRKTRIVRKSFDPETIKQVAASLSLAVRASRRSIKGTPARSAPSLKVLGRS